MFLNEKDGYITNVYLEGNLDPKDFKNIACGIRPPLKDKDKDKQE